MDGVFDIGLLSLSTVFRARLCCSMCQYFSFYLWANTTPWIDYILFGHLLMDIWIVFCLIYYEDCCYKYFCTSFLMGECLQFSRLYIHLAAELMDCSDHSLLNCLGYCQTDFNGCTVKHSHQQCVKVLDSPILTNTSCYRTILFYWL